MTPGSPDVLEQVPAGGNVAAPASGTYGDVKSLEDLKAALPGRSPAEPRAMEATPMAPGGPPPSPAQSSGPLPAGLFAPSTRPDQPASSPLTAPAAPIAGHPTEQRIQLLDLLSKSSDVSDETREWAKLVRDRIIRG